MGSWATRACVATCALLAACGARTGLRADAGPRDAVDVAADAPDDGDARAAEVCGNGRDDDGDGAVDEDCVACLRAGSTPWQIHRGGGPVCFGRTFARHGDQAMYAFEAIPDEGAAGWEARALERIDFSDPSTICASSCGCLAAGDFTFFQTFVTIPAGFRVERFIVSMRQVDDGAAVTVFNARFPSGVTDPRAFAFYPGGVTADLGTYLVEGRNRVVLSHVDDCCQTRSLLGVELQLNGGALTQCR